MADPRRHRPPGSRAPRGADPWPWVLLPAAAWIALRLLPQDAIDGVWVRQVLPELARLQAPAVAASPVSLTLLTGLAYAAVVAFALARRHVPGRSGVRWRGRERWGWAVVALLALGPAFEATWGLAYRRAPLEARLGLPSSAPTVDDVWAALVRAEAAVALLPATASVAIDAPWWSHALPAAADCVARADAHASARAAPLAVPARVRRLPAGSLLRGGFGGVQAPWWREPHVDGGLPPATALATALHELTHAVGWAREAETDALATLAGMACDDPEVRFAAGQHALLLLRAELLRLDPAARAPLETRWTALPAAVGDAWAAAREATRRYRQPAVQRLAGAAYDAYLRTQGVRAGLADYGRAGVLLAAALVACERGAEPSTATTAATAAAAAAPWCADP